MIREAVQFVCLVGMGVCGLLSLWPFRFSRRWKSWHLYLPLPAVFFYGLFEFAVVDGAELLGKLNVLLPLLMFILLNGMVKVGILAVLWDRAGKSRRRLRGLPQKSLQLAAAMLLAAGCAAWSWFLLK